MKRNEDNSGIIKIPDVSAVTASVAGNPPLQQPVFITRQQPPHIEMASRPGSGTASSQISLPRVAHAGGPPSGPTGVTVYRSDSSNPPLAHSGGVAVTTTPTASSTQQPPAAHHTPTVVNQQPPTTITPEQISKGFFHHCILICKLLFSCFSFIIALPTTPVSLPYGPTVTTTYSGSGPPIRTLTQQQPAVHRDHDQLANSLHPQNTHQQRSSAHQTFPNIRTVSVSLSIKKKP